MVKLLAVLGDYYHSAEIAKKSLENAVPYSGLEGVELIYCSYERLKDSLLDKPDGVILFRENRLNPSDRIVEEWLTEDLALEISRFVSNGGGWLAWHSGLASYPIESAYTKMLRGYFICHPEKHQLVRYRTDEKTFFSRPLSFEILDEHYFVYCDRDNTNVFLHSESIDGTSIAGWSHSYGDGKVCCLTPAHNENGLLNQEFLTVLGSCINRIVTKEK